MDSIHQVVALDESVAELLGDSVMQYFRGCLVSANYEGIVVVATSTHLLISDNSCGTQIVLETNPSSGRSTALKFVDMNDYIYPSRASEADREKIGMVCVGFESGDFGCFDEYGELIAELKPHGSALQAFQVSEGSVVDGSGQALWMLHEGGVLSTIPMQALTSSTGDTKDYYGLVTFKLVDHEMLNDFCISQSIYSSSIFEAYQAERADSTHSIFVGGMNSCLSVYNVGGAQQFQHMGKLAGYVKERVSGMISKTFRSFFSSGGSGESSKDNEVPITSLLDFEDPKRRILRLSADPSGSLLAAADNVGRVTLYDARINSVVRIWKGVRDARLAWDTSSGNGRVDDMRATTAPYPLALAIYAPQVGLLYFYGMRHGPLLRCIPVGQQCQLLSVVSPGELNSSR
jgi:Rab3 GTPase-activating protein regulatory subunit N-terminus